ncbi:hypothetical protein [Sphingobacterium paucimobilis]|uniref:hypothetical protein n=1 Tax=Sphingobacterium paucimobilis TaxID=1385985 RepID=UPI001182D123|nr:hypothetical protein [Sphingobacterium paucimobilis]
MNRLVYLIHLLPCLIDHPSHLINQLSLSNNHPVQLIVRPAHLMDHLLHLMDHLHHWVNRLLHLMDLPAQKDIQI